MLRQVQGARGAIHPGGLHLGDAPTRRCARCRCARCRWDSRCCWCSPSPSSLKSTRPWCVRWHGEPWASAWACMGRGARRASSGRVVVCLLRARAEPQHAWETARPLDTRFQGHASAVHPLHHVDPPRLQRTSAACLSAHRTRSRRQALACAASRRLASAQPLAMHACSLGAIERAPSVARHAVGLCFWRSLFRVRVRGQGSA